MQLKNLLAISVLFIILSIFFSALSLKLQTYALPFSHANYYHNKSKKAFDKNKIKNTVNASVVVFRDTLIDKYLESNDINAKESEFKAIMVTIAQWLFFVGLLLITASMFALLTKTS